MNAWRNTDLGTLWTQTVSRLRRDVVPEETLARWMRETAPISLEDGTLTIAVPDGETQRGIIERYLPLLEEALQDASLGEARLLSVLVQDAPEKTGCDAVWNTVLSRLQVDMPRTSYDIWVRETSLISLTDNKAVIGARNTYARDWLESRMKDAIAEILSAELGRPIQAQFVSVDDAGNESDDRISPAEKDPAKDGRSFDAEVIASDYERMARPERVVVIPGYALRLLEQGDLTPKEMSLWVGFRQAVYGQWKSGRGTVRNIPYREAIRFAMMSRASYFREISGRESLAGGMVETLPDDSGTNRYRVHMSPRLTRRDAAAVEAALRDEIGTAGSKVEAANRLIAALEALRAVPDLDVQGGADAPGNVIAIAQRILGELPPDVLKAAQAAQDRLLRAYGQAVIPHHFLLNTAPALRLTHPQAWLIIMLRDRCWFDYRSRTQQEYALVSMREAAAWMGVTLKSLKNWLRSPEFSAFVQAVQLEAGEGFVVHHTDPIPGDDLPAALEKMRLTLEKVRLEVEKMRLTDGKSETRFGNNETRSGKSETRNGKSETPLKLLNPYQPHKTSENPNQPRPLEKNDAPAAAPAGAGGWESAPAFSVWDLERLCETLDVNPATRPRLREAGVQAATLAAWLLHAMGARGVTDPVGFAIARSLDPRWRHRAGEDFAALARAAPRQLLGAIYRVLHPFREVPGLDSGVAALYRRVFGEDQRVSFALWRLLTGQPSCDGLIVESFKKEIAV